jgi:hypothetical protein
MVTPVAMQWVTGIHDGCSKNFFSKEKVLTFVFLKKSINGCDEL